MLHEVLAQYLARVEQAILRCSTAYVERYTEEILTPRRANLRIRLRFAQGHVLEVNELWRGGRGWPRGAGDGARPSDPGPLWEATQSDAAPRDDSQPTALWGASTLRARQCDVAPPHPGGREISPRWGGAPRGVVAPSRWRGDASARRGRLSPGGATPGAGVAIRGACLPTTPGSAGVPLSEE
jgi:hypothetical protein